MKEKTNNLIKISNGLIGENGLLSITYGSKSKKKQEMEDMTDQISDSKGKA